MTIWEVVAWPPVAAAELVMTLAAQGAPAVFLIMGIAPGYRLVNIMQGHASILKIHASAPAFSTPVHALEPTVPVACMVALRRTTVQLLEAIASEQTVLTCAEAMFSTYASMMSVNVAWILNAHTGRGTRTLTVIVAVQLVVLVRVTVRVMVTVMVKATVTVTETPKDLQEQLHHHRQKVNLCNQRKENGRCLLLVVQGYSKMRKTESLRIII